MFDIVWFVLIAIAAIVFLFFLWAGIVSVLEKEPGASKRFFVFSFILPLPYLVLALLNFPYHYEFGLTLIVISLLILFLLIIPKGRNSVYQPSIPLKRIDERHTMFSRNELVPGTDEFESYYSNNPDHLEPDNLFRSKTGLLKPGSTQYNPLQFSSADASFETIKALKNKVNGPVNAEKIKVETEQITNYIKHWSKKLGAVDFGITGLKDYHLYSVGGRAERRNEPVENYHKYAIAFTVEMDKTMVDSSPSGSIVMESGQQYLESGKIAIQTASFIRNLGYEARAHIDGNYEVVCPLVARDAGLGEIGRMGLLMTPKLGPRVRISVVTTDLPLKIDHALKDYSVIDFCRLCKKCADACPSQAISFNEQKKIDGVFRWQINQEACFTLWSQLGTDCGRCIAVCPYSHPDNLLHNFVRVGLKNSSLFRKGALKMDDYFYGRIPKPSPLPEWMNVNKIK